MALLVVSVMIVSVVSCSNPTGSGSGGSGGAGAGGGNTPVEKTLESISATPKKKSYKLSESVSASDVAVTALYSDGTKKTVTSHTVTHDAFTGAGKATVTVTYTENDITKTTTCEVTVVALDSIFVTKNFTGAYPVNGTIEDVDITVTATYSDRSSKTVTGWTSDGDFSAAGTDKKITISYAEDGITATATITIIIVSSYPVKYTFTTTATNLSGYNGTAGTSATYIEFGDWPQTLKEPLVKIDENKTTVRGIFTYYAGSDGNLYCKAQENARDTASRYKYSDGSTKVKLKSANSYKYFKVEPIKWRVLTTSYTGADTNSGNKKLLFAERGLMANVPYYDGYVYRTIGTKKVEVNNYEHSEIRAWLNGIEFQQLGSINSDHKDKGFLQTAFGDDTTVLAKILEVEIDNSLASTGVTFNKYTCNNTTDKIFLLSSAEVSNRYGFSGGVYDDAKRIREPTDFALANYAQIGNIGNTTSRGGWFFLRSPDNEYTFTVCGVGHSGSSSYGYRGNAYDKDRVIVPALCIAP